MKFAIKHWAPFRRQFPSSFPVAHFDYQDQKNSWVNRTFSVCAFSLILRGNGVFKRLGKTWQVEAPCVITQWPGETLEYGPPQPEGTWDELYIVYDAEIMPAFQKCRLVDLDRPIWPIADLPAVNEQIKELALLANSKTPERDVDRVDRVCERLVLETWLAPFNIDDRAIHAMLAAVLRDLKKPVYLEQMAEKNGMSISTFRRRWAAMNDVSPARYVQQLRIRKACQLLVETTMPIREIASEVGFEDEFYFSRRFSQETQMAPRQYRKAYQI